MVGNRAATRNKKLDIRHRGPVSISRRKRNSPVSKKVYTRKESSQYLSDQREPLSIETNAEISDSRRHFLKPRSTSAKNSEISTPEYKEIQPSCNCDNNIKLTIKNRKRRREASSIGRSSKISDTTSQSRRSIDLQEASTSRYTSSNVHSDTTEPSKESSNVSCAGFCTKTGNCNIKRRKEGVDTRSDRLEEGDPPSKIIIKKNKMSDLRVSKEDIVPFHAESLSLNANIQELPEFYSDGSNTVFADVRARKSSHNRRLEAETNKSDITDELEYAQLCAASDASPISASNSISSDQSSSSSKNPKKTFNSLSSSWFNFRKLFLSSSEIPPTVTETDVPFQVLSSFSNEVLLMNDSDTTRSHLRSYKPQSSAIQGNKHSLDEKFRPITENSFADVEWNQNSKSIAGEPLKEHRNPIHFSVDNTRTKKVSSNRLQAFASTALAKGKRTQNCKVSLKGNNPSSFVSESNSVNIATLGLGERASGNQGIAINRGGGSYIFNSQSSGINHRIMQLQQSLPDRSIQLILLQEINQALLMGSEEALSGIAVRNLVHCIIGLLDAAANDDDHGLIELKNLSCNVLAHLMDVLPKAADTIVPAIPLLLSTMSCSFVGDILERIIYVLEQISKRHGRQVMVYGGIMAVLGYYDFVTVAQHRTILSMIANCFSDLHEDDFNLISNCLPSLCERLQDPEPRCVERVCLCFARLIEIYRDRPEKLREIASIGLFQKLKIVMSTFPPVISNLKDIANMFATMCSHCPDLSVDLLKLGFAQTAYALLTNQIPPEEMQYTQSISTALNGDDSHLISPSSTFLAPCTPTKSNISLLLETRGQENVIALINFIMELMPSLPVNEHTKSNSLEHDSSPVCPKSDNLNRKRISVKILDTEMSENNKTVSSSDVRIYYFQRQCKILEENPEISNQVYDGKRTDSQNEELFIIDSVRLLLPLLFEIYAELNCLMSRIYCIEAINRMVYYSCPLLLSRSLSASSVCGMIATLLSSPELAIIVPGLRLAHLFIDRLPLFFSVYFRKEGVLFILNRLANIASAYNSIDKTSNTPTLETNVEEKMEIDGIQSGALSTGSHRYSQKKSNKGNKRRQNAEVSTEGFPSRNAVVSNFKMEYISSKSEKTEDSSISADDNFVSQKLQERKQYKLARRLPLESTVLSGSVISEDFNSDDSVATSSLSFSSSKSSKTIEVSTEIKMNTKMMHHCSDFVIQSWIASQSRRLHDKVVSLLDNNARESNETRKTLPALSKANNVKASRTTTLLKSVDTAKTCLFSKPHDFFPELKSIKVLLLTPSTDFSTYATGLRRMANVLIGISDNEKSGNNSHSFEVPSAFELQQSGLLWALKQFLTSPDERKLRILLFLQIFVGNSYIKDINLQDITPNSQKASKISETTCSAYSNGLSPFTILVANLLVCFQQQEHFQVINGPQLSTNLPESSRFSHQNPSSSRTNNSLFIKGSGSLSTDLTHNEKQIPSSTRQPIRPSNKWIYHNKVGIDDSSSSPCPAQITMTSCTPGFLKLELINEVSSEFFTHTSSSSESSHSNTAKSIKSDSNSLLKGTFWESAPLSMSLHVNALIPVCNLKRVLLQRSFLLSILGSSQDYNVDCESSQHDPHFPSVADFRRRLFHRRHAPGIVDEKSNSNIDDSPPVHVSEIHSITSNILSESSVSDTYAAVDSHLPIASKLVSEITYTHNTRTHSNRLEVGEKVQIPISSNQEQSGCLKAKPSTSRSHKNPYVVDHQKTLHCSPSGAHAVSISPSSTPRTGQDSFSSGGRYLRQKKEHVSVNLPMQENMVSHTDTISVHSSRHEKRCRALVDSSVEDTQPLISFSVDSSETVPTSCAPKSVLRRYRKTTKSEANSTCRSLTNQQKIMPLLAAFGMLQFSSGNNNQNSASNISSSKHRSLNSSTTKCSDQKPISNLNRTISRPAASQISKSASSSRNSQSNVCHSQNYDSESRVCPVFFIDGHRLPRDMPLYQAIRKYSPQISNKVMLLQSKNAFTMTEQEKEDKLNSYMWRLEHKIIFRFESLPVIPPPPKLSDSKSLHAPSRSRFSSDDGIASVLKPSFSPRQPISSLSTAINCLKRSRHVVSDDLALISSISSCSPSVRSVNVKSDSESLLFRSFNCLDTTLPSQSSDVNSSTDSVVPGEEYLNMNLILLRMLHSISEFSNTLDDMLPPFPILASRNFLCQKLSAKVSRQLKDTFCVLAGNLPNWLVQIVTKAPILFPFSVRHAFFYAHDFDRERSFLHLQDTSSTAPSNIDTSTASAYISPSSAFNNLSQSAAVTPPVTSPHFISNAASAEIESSPLSLITSSLIDGGSSNILNLQSSNSTANMFISSLASSYIGSTGLFSGLLDAGSNLTAPPLQRHKVTVHRDQKRLLREAESTISNLGNSRAVLEIAFHGEVGFGLGPTLEFYTLVSHYLMSSSLNLWHGHDYTAEGFIIAPASGLYPRPVGKNTRVALVREIRSKFFFLGQLMARSLLDWRQLDLPISPTLFKWFLHIRSASDLALNYNPAGVTSADIALVDPIFARHFYDLMKMSRRRHRLFNFTSTAELPVDIIRASPEFGHTLSDAGSQIELDALDAEIEALCLNFTLPGYQIELLKNGSHKYVIGANLDEYLYLCADWLLVEGTKRQILALIEGFDSVLPNVRENNLAVLFRPDECESLFCGGGGDAEETGLCYRDRMAFLKDPFMQHNDHPSASTSSTRKHSVTGWDVDTLMKACLFDHGYTIQSRAVHFLFEILSEFDDLERRLFVQFITGSPRLPVGGFLALKPPLKIVMKKENDDHADNHLPSVMTCQNYLKLPNYSSKNIMRKKLLFAIHEGQNSFLLS